MDRLPISDWMCKECVCKEEYEKQYQKVKMADDLETSELKIRMRMNPQTDKYEIFKPFRSIRHDPETSDLEINNLSRAKELAREGSSYINEEQQVVDDEEQHIDRCKEAAVVMLLLSERIIQRSP